MKKELRAKVILETINPKKYEAKFPTGRGLSGGETIEDCIAEAKEIYNDGYTKAIAIEVFVDGKTKTITICDDIK